MKAATTDALALYERDVKELHAGLADAAPCCVCGATRARPRFAVAGCAAPVVECATCGAARFDPMPSEAEVAAFYPAHYYGDLGRKFAAPIELLVRWVASRHAAFLVDGLPPGARVLDVGCGRGVTLAELARLGYEAHGFEISADAALGADARARVRIAPSLEQADYPDAHFDGVLVWHVLEHVRDPRRTLETVRRVAKPGARIVVAVPNFSSPQARWAGAGWFHLDLPRHLHHFPLAALRRLLEDTGFAVESEHHFSLRQNPFGWIQSWQNRRSDLPRNGLYTLLYHRTAGEPAPFDARTRRRLLAGFALAAAPALLASVIETLARRGATVHVVAKPR
jgi:2-polyprenyl-3-methyl-5-hydroxy-6-metoxy-1,4-benzoquinol methylase